MTKSWIFQLCGLHSVVGSQSKAGTGNVISITHKKKNRAFLLTWMLFQWDYLAKRRKSHVLEGDMGKQANRDERLS